MFFQSVRWNFELRIDNCGFGIACFVRPAVFWRGRFSAPEAHPLSAEIYDWGGAAGTEREFDAQFLR